MKKHLILIIFSVTFLLTGFFRFYNLNWDNGNYFHPDERNIAVAVTKINFFSQMDPEFFAYGGLSIYLYRGLGEILSLVTNNPSWTSSWEYINLIGRFCSALFSTLTVIPLFFLARKLWGDKVGIVTAILYSLSVFSIQVAHFAVTESFITFSGVLLGLLSIYLFEKRTYSYALLCGVVLGLAIAAKTSAISFAVFPLVALGLSVFKHMPMTKYILLKLVLLSLACFSMSILFFSLFSPFTFLNYERFADSMKYESGVVWGTLPVPYTLQFSGTLPYLFQVKNFFWQMGILPLFLPLSFYYLYKNSKQHLLRNLVFLSFPLAYFLYVGSWYTKFIRYMVPILPFLLILISFGLVSLERSYKKVGKGVLFIALGAALFWGMAYFSIYTRPQTRTAASIWMYRTIPTNSKILTEHWDDGLPVSVPPFSPMFQSQQLTLYDEDTPQKFLMISEQLSDSDYIAINSRRLYGTMLHLPQKYPLTKRYYEQLFAENLGYTKAAEFTSYPSFLGITIPDDASEETFQVYDHPKVLLFKNTQRLSSQEIYTKIVETK